MYYKIIIAGRVPIHHVFAANNPKLKQIKYGDVLDVHRLQVVEELVYSKKKKRDIKKVKVQMICALWKGNKRKWPRDRLSRGELQLTVKYDASIFV